jgi:hypothetical protein
MSLPVRDHSLRQSSAHLQGVSESSRTGSEKKCWLNLLNFGCHLLQNSILGNVYSDPIIFSTLQKHRGSHIPECCRVPFAILLGYQTLFQSVIPSVSFSIWETQRNLRGLSPASREDGELSVQRILSRVG